MSDYNPSPSSLKAIETVYSGYKFRSRLEAKWAIFFDAVGVCYDYEPEGYDLEEAGWYLPDFKLFEGNYVEIKPRNQWKYDLKAQKLAVVSGTPVLYICGNPHPGEYGICRYSPNNTCTGSDPLEFALHRKNSDLWVAFEGDVGFYFPIRPTEQTGFPPTIHCPVILEALKTARQARFEHGESP